MRTYVILVLLLALAGCKSSPPAATPCSAAPAAVPTSATSSTPDAREVEDAMRAYSDARAKGDVDALERLLTPDYVHIHVDGQVQGGKAWLDEVRARTSEAKVAQEDVKIRMLGDVAVVTGKNVVHGADGKDMILRFTQVWVKKDGAWRRAFFQGTAIR